MLKAVEKGFNKIPLPAPHFVFGFVVFAYVAPLVVRLQHAAEATDFSERKLSAKSAPTFRTHLTHPVVCRHCLISNFEQS